MANHFSANQYENAFTSKKLGNWESPSQYRDNPKALTGFTQIVANDRGHLLDGAPKSTQNPWGNFTGTWDLPKKIAGNCATVPTGRTSYAQQKLMMEAMAAQDVLSGDTKNQQRKAKASTMVPAAAAPPDVDAPPIPFSPLVPTPDRPVEVMCDVLVDTRSPTPPVKSPVAANPALIDTDDKPLFRSADL